MKNKLDGVGGAVWIKRSGGAGCSLEVNKQGGLEGVEGGGGL